MASPSCTDSQNSHHLPTRSSTKISMARKKRLASVADDVASKHTKRPRIGYGDIRVTRGAARRTADPGTSDGAFNAVMGTTELFERILGELPVRDLFVVGCVSKRFQQVIEGTEVLQRRMHLRPTSSAPVRYHFDQKDVLDGRHMNQYKVATPQMLATLNDTEFFTPVELCPAVLIPGHRWRAKLLARLEITGSVDTRHEQLHWPDIVDRKRKLVNLEVKQSWHDTYVTQPPCREIRARLTFAAGNSWIESKEDQYALIHKTDGVKWTDVITAAFDQAVRRGGNWDPVYGPGVSTMGQAVREKEASKGVAATLYMVRITALSGVVLPLA